MAGLLKSLLVKRCVDFRSKAQEGKKEWDIMERGECIILVDIC